MPGDPRLQQVVGIENDISDLDVDITVEEGMDIPSLQQETFQTLVQLAGMQPGLIPGDVLIAASGLRDKDMLLQRMKEHQQQQAQVQQQAGQLATQHAQADIQGKQAKAQADFALAAERKVNAAAGVHNIHSDFSAPPYGQPNVAPDNPPGAPDPTMQQQDPEQMDPQMALMHHMADLAKKQADIRNTQATTALTAATHPADAITRQCRRQLTPIGCCKRPFHSQQRPQRGNAMPATATGRGAQVVLDSQSDTAKAVRGAYAATFEANAAKVAADIVAGVVSSGNRPDGTTSTAAVATDHAVNPMASGGTWATAGNASIGGTITTGRGVATITAGNPSWVVSDGTNSSGMFCSGTGFSLGPTTTAGVPTGPYWAYMAPTGVQFGVPVGFNSTAPINRPTVSGSKGANAALTSLLTALANYGLITDSST